ncbi:MAG: FAD-dependent oxidoreductase, partial [Saprospiraceae bacterium]
QVGYFDAAYGQNTQQHILGLFAVGTPALPYLQRSGNDLIQYILDELDDIFSNQASPNFVRHTVQNWNNEPFIRGAYLNDYEDWRKVRTLSESVSNKVYFAGEAYTDGEDWGSVHTAAQAARSMVLELIK